MIEYTAKQITAMIKRIENTPDGVIFKLNKHDVCPLDVYLARTSRSIKLYDAETGSPLAECGGSPNGWLTTHAMVEIIIDMINDWDRVTKCHFADLSRKLGYDY